MKKEIMNNPNNSFDFFEDNYSNAVKNFEYFEEEVSRKTKLINSLNPKYDRS